MSDDHDDAPTFEAGKWYLFFAPDFFTMVGKYIRPVGEGKHRWRHVIHLINGGGQLLPEFCVNGPPKGNSNFKMSPPFPRDLTIGVKGSTEYLGPTPWVKEGKQ